MDRAHPNGADGGNRLLAAMRPVDFSLLAPDLKRITLTQGDMLHESGQPITQIYFPLDGMISMLAVMKNGGAVETATVGREGAAGISAGLGSRRASGRSVVQVAGRASRITARNFEAAVSRSTSLKSLIVLYNDALMTMIQQSAGCNALHPIEARLCRWLLQTCDRSNSDRLPLTHEFLSEMLGVRRPTVTLVARRLQSAGLIRYSRGRIDIVGRRGLEKKSCECYQVVRNCVEDVFSKLKI